MNDDDDGGVGVGEVAVDESGNEGDAALVTELKEELRRMDELQESLVREVVLRGRGDAEAGGRGGGQLQNNLGRSAGFDLEMQL